MAERYYVATVHLLIKVDELGGLAEACDAVAESLRPLKHSGAIEDWQYISQNTEAGLRTTYPIATDIPTDVVRDEGEVFGLLEEQNRLPVFHYGQ